MCECYRCLLAKASGHRLVSKVAEGAEGGPKPRHSNQEAFGLSCELWSQPLQDVGLPSAPNAP